MDYVLTCALHRDRFCYNFTIIIINAITNNIIYYKVNVMCVEPCSLLTVQMKWFERNFLPDM